MLRHTGEKPFKCVICNAEFLLFGTISNAANTQRGQLKHTC